MSLSSIILPGDWPLPAFHFKVVFHHVSFLAMDTSFQEVAGLDSQIETEEYREGGDNHFVYHLPKAVKNGNLVLKRGVAPITSPLVLWCQQTLGDDFSTIQRVDLSVMLLDEDGIPVRMWNFTGAYPLSWKVESFHATKNEVAIEEITLCYNETSRVM